MVPHDRSKRLWTRGLRDQCAAHGAAFHFKQWGNWRSGNQEDGSEQKTRQLRTRAGVRIQMVNVGKKSAGRELDEPEWDEVPVVAP
jgi:protein gp37